MQDFRNLLVWQKAHRLALSVYEITEAFPASERYGLTAQIRRSAVSVPSNIAEGCGRGGWPELINFCQIAFGSLSELEYQLILAKDLRYVSEVQYQQEAGLLAEVKRMLGAFLATLRRQAGKPRIPIHTKPRLQPADQVNTSSTDALTH
jgi:four helix bundle protein